MAEAKSLKEIVKIRLKKRKTLKDLGDNPYPVFVKRTHSIQEALDEFFKLSKEEKLVKLTPQKALNACLPAGRA